MTQMIDTTLIFCGLLSVAYCLAMAIGILFESAESFEPEVVLYIDEKGNLVPKDSAEM